MKKTFQSEVIAEKGAVEQHTRPSVKSPSSKYLMMALRRDRFHCTMRFLGGGGRRLYTIDEAQSRKEDSHEERRVKSRN